MFVFWCLLKEIKNALTCETISEINFGKHGGGREGGEFEFLGAINIKRYIGHLFWGLHRLEVSFRLIAMM